MTGLNAISFVGIGFLFATGAMFAWIMFQLIAILIRDICQTILLKRLKKTFKLKKSTKPKGMEFGKND